jgi:DNA-binding response OmpR family regulator
MASIPEILLIEDGTDDRDRFAMALASSGVRALLSPVSSVTEAVLRIKRLGVHAGCRLPALILVDLALVNPDGLALIELIQRAIAEVAVPLVVLSSVHCQTQRARCLELGIAGFQRTPDAFAELVALVCTLQRYFPGQDAPAALVAAGQAWA